MRKLLSHPGLRLALSLLVSADALSYLLHGAPIDAVVLLVAAWLLAPVTVRHAIVSREWSLPSNEVASEPAEPVRPQLWLPGDPR